MEFKELLSIGRDLKRNKCTDIKEYLEMIQTFDNCQKNVFYILISNDVDIEKAIEGVYNEQFSVYNNFYEYIDNLLDEPCNDLPNFIELDYLSMWFRTFRYDENFYIDWQEWEWSKNRDEYGTNEQKELYRDYIKFNLERSNVIDFYY